MPPAPPFLWPARWHSLVLALGVTLFRSMGYYGAHVRALIWDAFSCRAAQPRGFPLGGSCHRRGLMRGRSCPQPFLVERSAYRPDAFLLLPRWATRSPPHPPQCAHWGTFPPEGKALGGGGTAGWNLSFTKMLSNIFSLENASQIGLGIPEETAPLSYQRQRSPKRASESERAMTPGVQGQSPGPLSPHFSGEMGTPAGQAGPPGRCAPRPGKAPTTRRVRSTASPPGPRPHLRAPTPSGTNRNI